MLNNELKLKYWSTPILVSVFHVLLLISSNLEELLIAREILGSTVIIILFGIITFLFSSLVLKRLDKGSLFSSYIIFIFFSYGYLIIFLNEVINFSEPLGRHRYLLPCLLLISAFIFFAVYKEKFNVRKVLNLVFFSFLIIFAVNVVQITYYYLYSPIKMNDIFEMPESSVSMENLPDVYHIILDMYPSENILLTRFDFDNSKFLLGLEELGFKNHKGNSNYSATIYSIPSAINLNYVHNIPEQKLNSAVQKTTYSFNLSLESQIAQKLGYKVAQFYTHEHKTGIGWLFGDFNYLYLKTSILRVLDDSPIPIHNFWVKKDSVFFKENLKNVSRILENPDSTWTYFYSRPPHPPYIFNEDGSIKIKKSYDDDFVTDKTGEWNDVAKKAYISQLKYVNSEIIKLIKMIVNTSEQTPIIILHSDHGVYNLMGKLNENSTESFEESFHVLFSTLTPKECDLPEQISNVNVIRIILNECFDYEFDILENSAYWGTKTGDTNDFSPAGIK